MKPHWSFRYLLRRFPDWIDQKTQLDSPWLNPKIREALDSLLQPTDFMVECGSGRSTLWFARRVQQLLSIEFDPEWLKHVQQKLAAAQIRNVDLRFVDYSLEGDQQNNEYIACLTALPDSSIDVCLIDGGPRSYCAMALLSKLKPGGLLVIDDVHNFLPSDSESPNAIRRAEDIPTTYAGKVSLNWPDVYTAIRSWRRLWLSNGVRDTAIFFKPSC
jgi:SAM-dependent methyltransferase